MSAVRLLGYDKLALNDVTMDKNILDFWNALEAHKKNDPWYDIFTDAEILQTLSSLQSFLDLHPPALYKSPEPMHFGQLLTR